MRNVKSSYVGAKVQGIIQEHEVHMKFRGEEDLVFSRADLHSMNATPEGVLEILEILYPKT